MELISSVKSWLIVLVVILLVGSIIRDRVKAKRKIEKKILFLRGYIESLRKKGRDRPAVLRAILESVSLLGIISDRYFNGYSKTKTLNYLTCLELYLGGLDYFLQLDINSPNYSAYNNDYLSRILLHIEEKVPCMQSKQLLVYFEAKEFLDKMRKVDPDETMFMIKRIKHIGIFKI